MGIAGCVESYTAVDRQIPIDIQCITGCFGSAAAEREIVETAAEGLRCPIYTLAERLSEGDYPGWLTPVDLPAETGVLLFRVAE